MNDLNHIKILMNWAVGANLHDIRDKEKLILKGHIYLDHLLAKISKTDSFYKKTLFLENHNAKQELIELLIELNTIRNHIAHEVKEIDEKEYLDWSEKVITKFPSDYDIRKTKRTKLILAFTALSNELFETLYQ